MRKLALAKILHRDSGVAKQAAGPWVEATRVRGHFPDAPQPQQTAHNSFDTDITAALSNGRRRGLFRSTKPVVALPERPPSEALWFYRGLGHDDEAAKGPCSTDEMEQLVERGVVRASTLVLKQGEAHWETAISAGLFLDDPREDGEHKNDAPPAVEKEEVLWDGKPSHHANFNTYALCVLTSPLIFPAWWGMKKYAARGRLRYQITSRPVRLMHMGSVSTHKDISLSDIREAALVSPLSLKTTNLCDIQLFGTDPKKPLAVLEGIPLTQSALVISLCEASVHRQIPMRAKERILVAAKAQEEEVLRRAEEQHRQEMEALRSEMHGKIQTERDRRSTPDSEDIDWFAPPPPRTRPQPSSRGLTGLMLGIGAASWMFGTTTKRRKAKRTLRVKGHYRGRTWVKAHDRELDP